MNLFQRFTTAFKLTKSFGTVSSTWGTYLTGGGLDKGKAATSTTMAACRNYITQAINEAPLIVEKKTMKGDGWEETDFPPELEWLTADLISNGVIQQTHASRMAGAAWDLLVTQNAMFVPVKNQSGKQVALEFVPWGFVNPQFGNTQNVLIGYRIGSSSKLYTADEVIHVRLGMDPDRPCLGYSNEPALREAVTADSDGNRYMARVLNAPAPSLVAQFKDSLLGENKDNREMLKQAIIKASVGENAGGVAVSSAEIVLERVGFSPEQMALDKLTKAPQFAICSVFNIPVQALPLAAASESSTYANVAEARKAAATNCAVPIWNAIGQAFSTKFVPDGSLKIRFNYANVMALQPDMQIMAERAEKLYRAGVIDRADAKKMAGQEFGAEDVGHYASEDKLASPIGNNEAQKIRDAVGA